MPAGAYFAYNSSFVFVGTEQICQNILGENCETELEV